VSLPAVHAPVKAVFSAHCAGAAAGCRDCWCVAIGNSYDNEERCVLAGYDNGDVKMFDLRMNKVRQVRHALQAAVAGQAAVHVHLRSM
jgi:hypothetical protein